MISVAYDGAVCSSFFQPHAWFASEKVVSIVLYNGRELNQALANFICYTIYHQRGKYSYGYKFSVNKRMKKQSIILPIDANGNPDYDFMEAYVKEQERTKVDLYAQYCKDSLKKLGKQIGICDISQKEWHEFFVDDIFTIDSGKRLESYNMTAGSRPFIGATDSGNGVTNYISNENESLDSNVLGVNYNGNGMVISFYHPYECLFSDDVKRFHLKNHPDNKYVLLFFKTLILQQKAKYNYGYKFNATRMKRQKIMLPVTETGEPDYAYMEQYAKNMMIRKYQQYLDYYEAPYSEQSR